MQSLSQSASGTLDLRVGNLLTSTGSDSFGGTLNILGFSGGTAELISYSSRSGTFGIVTGLTGAYQLVYTANQLDIVPSGPPTWQLATSGSWNDTSKWDTNTVPSGIGQSAVVSAATSASLTITLDGPQTLGALTFADSSSSGNHPAGYTLSAGSGGSLTLDNSGSAAQIIVANGKHTIATPVYLVGGDLTVSASNSGIVNISGSITQDATRNLILNGDGSGELILSGTNALGGIGGIATVSSGTLMLTNPHALADGTSLTVGNASLFGGIQPAGAAVASGTNSSPSPLAVVPVPEPGTLLLLAVVVAAGAINRRQKTKNGKNIDTRFMVG